MFKSSILVAAMFVSGAAMATPSFTIPTLPTPNTNTNLNTNTNSNLNNNANLNTNLNTNANANLNTNTMGQGQMQGQGQGQGQSAIGIGGSSTGGSAHSNSSANNQNSVANSVTVEAQERDPVSTATAPTLATSNGTCMGSTSAGAQGASFGFSVGGTWVDSGCDARYDAVALISMNERAAAKARLCMKPEIREAIENAGGTCDVAKPVEQKVSVETKANPIAAFAGCSYKGNDSIVAARTCK